MSTDAATSPPTPGAQPERTALAWQRTALAAATGAAVVGRLALADLGPVAVVVMTASLVMALAAFVLGRRRYLAPHEDPSRRRDGRAPALLALAVLAIGVTELVALLSR